MKFLFAIVPFAMASAGVINQAPNTLIAKSNIVEGIGDVGVNGRADQALWENPTGQTLSTKIQNKLKRDKNLKGVLKNIDVENKNGQITLRGQVPNRTVEQNVIKRVRGMGGVAGVTSELTVGTQ